MDYCRDLKFEEKPDYTYLRRIFKDLFNKMGYEYDFVYDWHKLERKARRRAGSNTRGDHTTNTKHKGTHNEMQGMSP